MAASPITGRLEPGSAAPASGERVVVLLERPGLTVEQILTGALPEPLAFEQAHDEWALLVEGAARLEVAGQEVALEAGAWLYLPAGCPHTLLETTPGASWLAVHLRRDG